MATAAPGFNARPPHEALSFEGRCPLTELTEAQQAHLPMSETAFYILLSLTTSNHGYGIMQHVEEMTEGRLRLGPGTLYGTLSRMQQDNLIEVADEKNRRKVYNITAAGLRVLQRELDRLNELYTNGIRLLEVINQ